MNQNRRDLQSKVTLTGFKVAKMTINLKMESEEELARLESFFKVNTGLTLQEQKNCQNRIQKWPETPSAKTDVTSSPLLALSQAEVELAAAELKQAQGESWPTVRVGPSLKMVKDSGEDVNQWGVNLSMLCLS